VSLSLPSLLLLTAALSAAPPAADPPAPQPPEGAQVLFDGKDASKWANAKLTAEGYLKAGAVTKDKFTDFTLHVEFLLDFDPAAKNPGNSGIYLQQRYEVQILNTAGKEAPGKGDCGAIYKFRAPGSNAARPPRQWQTYDITFTAPRWEGGQKVKNARISVVHNGVKIHDDVEVPAKTGAGRPEGPEAGPIQLQDHGSPVVFRNIWIVEKKD
jgi:hypothetical protein